MSYCLLNHSNEKREYNLEQGLSTYESLCHLQIYRTAQNTGYHFLKNMAFSGEGQPLAGGFLAILDKIKTNMSQITKKCTA